MLIKRLLKTALFTIFLFMLNYCFAQKSEIFISFSEEREWKILKNASLDSKFYTIRGDGPDNLNKFLGKIEYGFQTPGNDYLQITSIKSILQPVQKLKIWVKGDKMGALLKLLFRDENKEIFIIDLAKINWYGWKQIEKNFIITESYGGDDNGIIDGSLQFYGFLLEDEENDQVISGDLMLSDLEFFYKQVGVQKEEKQEEIIQKHEEETAIEQKKGVFFSGLASFTFDDVDTSGSTNENDYNEQIIRKSLLHQYFDLIIQGQLYEDASIFAKIRIEKGLLGWTSDKKEDYYNPNYSRAGFELEKMQIKGSALGFNNTLTIGRIHPVFTSYALSRVLYGAQWDLTKGNFKSTLVGARPESTITDKGGLYTNNDEYNIYLLGLRESYKIGSLQLSASLVNVHQNKGVFTSGKNFLKGYKESPVAALYFKMSDNSPDDDLGGDLINLQFYENGVLKYDITPDDGENEKDFFIEKYGDTGVFDAGPWRWTKFDSYFVYCLPLSDAQSVEIQFETQNNYRIEISIDGINWIPVLLSPTDIKDYSNRGIKGIRINADHSIEVNYGSGYIDSVYVLDIKKIYKQTGKTIVGFDISGSVFKTDIHFEYTTIYEHRIYPQGKRKDKNIGYAVYLNLSRHIHWLHLKGAIFDISPQYDTGFSQINTVDDNDDQDMWPDHWQDEIVRFIDENNNGIPDNEERPPYRQISLYIINDYFKPLIDNDNNDIQDDRQNDDLPDYKYKINQFGYSLQSVIRKIRFLDFIIGYKDIKAKRGSNYDREIHLGCEFKKKLKNKSKISFIHITKKINDTIPDDLVNYNDTLNYKNNLVNTTAVFFDYRLFFDIFLKSKLQYIHNTYIRSKSNVQNAETVIKLSKTIPIIYELKLLPTVFSRCNKDISSTHSPYIYYLGQIKNNLFDNRGILEIAYYFNHSSKIFTGIQYGLYESFRFSEFKYKVTSFVLGTAGSGIGSFQYGVEYKREKYDFDSKNFKDSLISSIYAHISYRF